MPKVNKYKKCVKCKKLKLLDNFAKHKHTIDGLNVWCKDCNRDGVDKYHKTIKGVLSVMYLGQKSSSKKRGMELPNYTKEEFKKWVLTQELFFYLYDEWVKSGYNSLLKPSVDRINDYKSYTLDNIELTTWGKNKAKYHKYRINGNNTKATIAVTQLALNGDFIKDFYSIAQASRETGANMVCIRRSCKGKQVTANSFRWKYKAN